ncbi:uncharacterized protein LOC6501480 [Drosophila ananassae]|nr:uncharacterized protein LOC6501480 [Drosophila ananassae]
MSPNRCSLSLFFISIQLLGFVPAAPSDNSIDNPDASFDIMMDQSDYLPAELQLKLLQVEREQEDLEMVRMQLMQLNLLKLLIVLDILIVLCLYFYICLARENYTDADRMIVKC